MRVIHSGLGSESKKTGDFHCERRTNPEQSVCSVTKSVCGCTCGLLHEIRRSEDAVSFQMMTLCMRTPCAQVQEGLMGALITIGPVMH